jgi:predicted nucleic acid-binding Zn ribbon protein
MLIDKYLPHYNYHEHHHTIVKAGAKNCFLTAKELDVSRSWITKTLMKLRGLPTNDLKLQGFLQNICFTYIEEDPYKEFLIDASQPGLKIFWNFYFKSISADETIVSTETRILCLSQKVKRRFAMYWFFVRPFSGLIRIEILRLIKKKLTLTTQ